MPDSFPVRHILLLLLGMTLLSSAVWRLGNPPLMPREANWMSSGIDHLNSGFYRYARERFRKVLSLNPDNARARELWETAQFHRFHSPNPGAFDAKAFLAHLQKRYPSSPYVRVIDGEIALREGDLEKALKALGAISKSHPDIANNWYNLGLAEARSGYHDRAAESFLMAVMKHPRGKYHTALGHELFRLGQLEKAADAFEAARVVDPWRVDAWIGYFRSLLHLGELALAQDAGKALRHRLRNNAEGVAKHGPKAVLPFGTGPEATISGLGPDLIAQIVELELGWIHQRLADPASVDLQIPAVIPDTIRPVLEFDAQALETMLER